MALSDFNNYGDASKASLNDSVVQEGSGSLEMSDTGGSDVAVVLDQSETDSPTEARLEFWAKAGDQRGYVFGVTSRHQDNTNNYTFAFYYAEGSNNPFVEFYKRTGASGTLIGSIKILDGNLADISLSDGSSAMEWNPYRVDFWLDSNDDFRVRLEEDADEDGTWTQIGNDLVDSSPDLESGGGLGVRSESGLTAGDKPRNWYVDDMDFIY